MNVVYNKEIYDDECGRRAMAATEAGAAADALADAAAGACGLPPRVGHRDVTVQVNHST